MRGASQDWFNASSDEAKAYALSVCGVYEVRVRQACMLLGLPAGVHSSILRESARLQSASGPREPVTMSQHTVQLYRELVMGSEGTERDVNSARRKSK